MSMDFIIRNHNGFPFGFTSITRIGELMHDTGIDFGILRLKSGEEQIVTSHLESAYLLIQGQCMFMYDGVSNKAERHSCFDEGPYALHCASNHSIKIKALADSELAVSQVENSNSFPTRFFDPNTIVECDERGKGILNNTACRIVRTIFDNRNSPESKLVLGEVVTPPGCWSSYPPHHHPHPEIYHYRFTEPQGYGHAECGDEVFKVKQFDTYKILHEHDHAQAAAPGYGMYYIWIIRHLNNNPYICPEFTEEHSWTKTKSANTRVWQGIK